MIVSWLANRIALGVDRVSLRLTIHGRSVAFNAAAIDVAYILSAAERWGTCGMGFKVYIPSFEQLAWLEAGASGKVVQIGGRNYLDGAFSFVILNQSDELDVFVAADKVCEVVKHGTTDWIISQLSNEQIAKFKFRAQTEGGPRLAAPTLKLRQNNTGAFRLLLEDASISCISGVDPAGNQNEFFYPNKTHQTQTAKLSPDFQSQAYPITVEKSGFWVSTGVIGPQRVVRF